MRIDRLRIQNFKKFSCFTLELDPHFNLLVGENGSGKTSLLEALTVALGIWLVKPPDPELNGSRRNISRYDVRLEGRKDGDRLQFFPHRPVRIEAEGYVQARQLRWVRQIGEHGERTSNLEATATIDWIQENYRLDRQQRVIFPVLAYYGAGRAWLPSNVRPGNKASKSPARRWSAFYDCFSERVHFSQLVDWFRREAMAALSRQGRYRTGYEIVKIAVARCLPGAEDLWFDPDRQEVVLAIDGQAQPMGNLSAGQKMMLAMVADLAIKAVIQNNCLVEEDLTPGLGERVTSKMPQLPAVLERTPGVVLIDELDVHLHPLWQRRIVEDLKTTFPSIQFVVTSHSPYIIQSLGNSRLIRLGAEPIQLETESLEDIAEWVQGVPSPHCSQRAKTLEEATARYFRLLRQKPSVSEQELARAELEYRIASTGFTGQPGLEAILKLEALAAEQRAT